MICKNDVIVVNNERSLVYEIVNIVFIDKSDKSYCISFNLMIYEVAQKQ